MAASLQASSSARAAVTEQFHRRLRRISYVPIAVLLGLAFLLAWAVSEVLNRARWIEHTYAVLGQAHRCLALAVDTQSGMRGFQLTGEPEFLTPYAAARERAQAEWTRLEALVSDNAAQRARVAALHQRLDVYVAAAERAIAARRNGAPVDVAVSRELKGQFDDIRTGFGELIATEERLLAERTHAYESIGRWLMPLRFGAALACGVFLTLVVRRQIQGLNATYERSVEEVQTTAETLNVTLRSIGDGVITTDLAGRVTFLNPVAETLTGWSTADAKGRPIADVFVVVSEQSAEPLENPVVRVLREKKIAVLSRSAALIARDGMRRSIADSAAPIRAAGDAMIGVVLVFRDVTAERKAEAERARLVELVEHSTDFIGVAELDGRLVYLNRAGRRMVGIGDADDLSGVRFTDYVPESWQQFFRTTVMPTVLERGLWEGEMQLVNLKTQVVVDVLRSTFLLRDEQTGKALGFATVTRDITAWKRAERALRETAERHRLALEVAGLGTWEWDLRSGQISFDARGGELLGGGAGSGSTQNEFINRIDPEDRERVRAAFDAALAQSGSALDIEFRMGMGGVTRFVRMRGHTLASDTQPARTVRLVGAALDVTAERARRQELELRVAERTRELTAANERLKELDRLKSEFLASMSHELRTPLNSIIGFTEIVLAGLAGPLNEEQGRQLQMSLNSGRHLLALINDLLDLARIEAGRAAPHDRWFDLRGVLDEVANTLAPLAAQKALPVAVHIAGDTRMISDRKMVYQIILNLAGNAVKFTERGRVEIRCEAVGDTIEVRVIDTGIGIKSENVRLLFEAFRQLEGSARRRFEGTGLGLHLSKRLVDLLGGTISVESEFGRGSTFTLTLPKARPA
jgi:PAS domain S-box-containing protein